MALEKIIAARLKCAYKKIYQRGFFISFYFAFAKINELCADVVCFMKTMIDKYMYTLNRSL